MRYLLFHKPYGVLPQFSDRSPQPRPTLADFVPIPHVYPAGRLDRDSEGLMLLTDDGKLQHRLCHPQFAHPRTYLVQVERIPDPESLRRLAEGVVIEGYRTRPCQVELLPHEPPGIAPRHPPIRYRATVPTAWLKLTLREGKNRQVRKMTASIGFPTLRLIRIAIAHLQLADLPVGAYRSLSAKELRELRQLTGLGGRADGYNQQVIREKQLAGNPIDLL
jgi:23S rRNA pseudouridine2457 synthase